MAYPQVLGLPASMDYKMPPAISDGCRAYSVHQAPDGITTMTSNPPPATLFVANSSCAVSSFGGGQVISFTLPSGMGSNVFMSPWDTTLSFNLSYTVNTALVVGTSTGLALNLIGSAASFFDSCVVYSNSVPLETINGYGQLQNFLLANTVSQSERFGGISVAMGADNNSNTGVDLAFSGTVGTTYNYSFCIPLMSILGYNSSKLIPIGSVSNLQLQMTITSGNFPITSFAATVAGITQPVFSGFTLNNFSLNMKYISLDDMSASLLRQTLQDGKWFVRADTYTQSSAVLPSGSSGNQQILLQIRNSSVRSVLQYFNTSAVLGICPNHIYDAIGINTNSRQLQIAGAYFPNRPLNDLARPAEAYCYLVQSLTGVASPVKALGSAVDRYSYNAHLSAAAPGSDTSIVLPANCQRPAAPGSDAAAVQVNKFPNSAYYGYDTERISGSLLSGTNTRASPPFLNCNIQVSTPQTITCSAWGLSDVILVFDVNSQTVQAYI